MEGLIGHGKADSDCFSDLRPSSLKLAAPKISE